MDASQGEQRSIQDWDENQVQAWLSSIGFPQYEAQIKEHNISGDVLCLLDPDGLKSVGVSTIGQRLAILKHVYLTKLAHNVPIEPDHYVPPSEAQDRQENITVDKLYTMVKELEKQMRSIEEDNHYLRDLLQATLDEHGIRPNGTEDSPLQRQGSFKWATYVKPARSPTKPDTVDSPHDSPQAVEHPGIYSLTDASKPTFPPSTSTSSQRTRAQPSTNDPSPNSSEAQLVAPPKAQRQDSSDNLKSFKVSLDDPTWKVLPAALKKYKINNDNWQNYAMFICYGSPGNRIERCLAYDEKPLLLFQKLKDAKKNPVFMLKHIKDIRSPIAVAQQKHAARKASSSSEPSSAPPKPSPSSSAVAPGHTRTASRPPKLEVHDLSAGAPILTAGASNSQPGWPEVMSPSVDNKERAEELGGGAGTPGSGGMPVPSPNHPTGTPSTAGSTLVGSIDGSRTSRATTLGGSTADPAEGSGGGGHARDTPITTTGVSYAVAIYPYMAEQEDEFDVVVGDTFVILSRARGWWVVQRDPTGSGIVETDTSKQGWVPAGCLLETNVPVASAIAEATAAKASSTSNLNSNSPPSSPVTKTPILPLSIISTSFPGVALMEYKKKGEEELDLNKDDSLRVFKRYNHWSYAVKEEGGDRGWVPSWFIGKVSSSSGLTPATPNTSIAATNTSSASTAPVTLAEPEVQNGQNQISPMSSAFPVQTARTFV